MPTVFASVSILGSAPTHRPVVEELERSPMLQFAVQKHVVVDAEPVDQRQILVQLHAEEAEERRAFLVATPQPDDDRLRR